MSAVIFCKGLEKKYGLKKVLKGIDLEIDQGTIVALLGTNGAGKTTLIRTLLGLIPKTKGEVLVLGEEPYKIGAQLRQKIGYVSEEQGLYGWMSVGEIINFCKSLYSSWDDLWVERYLNRFHINTKTKIDTLSKGQQVKLALLLAMAPKPELLILDEPMSGLDPLAQHEFLQVVMKDINSEGRTIFFSTHNLADAMLIAEKVAIVNDGKIQAFGSINDVCNTVFKVRVTTDVSFLPPIDALLLSEEANEKIYLFSASEVLPEIASTAEDPSSMISPVSLEEAFLFYCSRGND